MEIPGSSADRRRIRSISGAALRVFRTEVGHAPVRASTLRRFRFLPVHSTQTARLDRAQTSRLYRRAWAKRRCVIPINGYFKWERNPASTRVDALLSPAPASEPRPRQPYFIQSGAGDVLFAPGLWSLWGDAESEHVLSFSILTHANPAIPAPLFPDGPLFVEPERIGDWIQADPASARRALLRMAQPKLEAYAVSRRVANRKLDDYSLLEPASAIEEVDTPFDQDELDEDE